MCNKDQFSKYAERQANTQIYKVREIDMFVLLRLGSLWERASKEKLLLTSCGVFLS
jgi:hypothetical protein